VLRGVTDELHRCVPGGTAALDAGAELIYDYGADNEGGDTAPRPTHASSVRPPRPRVPRFDFYLEGQVSGPKLKAFGRGLQLLPRRRTRQSSNPWGITTRRRKRVRAGSRTRGDSGGSSPSSQSASTFPDEQPRTLVGETDRYRGTRAGRRVHGRVHVRHTAPNQTGSFQVGLCSAPRRPFR